MRNALVAKLERKFNLTAEDRARLDSIIRHPRRVARHITLIHEGESSSVVRVLVDGLAYRYKLLPNGCRQITAFLVPGDFCDFHTTILDTIDHSVATLTPSAIAEITHSAITDLTTHHAQVARAFRWSILADGAILREWLANIGRRSATQRIAHLLCELLVRLHYVGWATETSYDLPVTQQELGEALGLSTVQVNRSLQALRAQELLVFTGGKVTIPDFVRLKELSGFTPEYIQMTPMSNEVIERRSSGFGA